jgi:hypothetical protein
MQVAAFDVTRHHKRRQPMSFDGTWNIEISSPMGAQKATVNLKADGATLTGEQTSPQGNSAIENGKIEGDRATWTSSVTAPMPMKLTFDLTRSGDTLSGTVNTGAFGSFPVKGARA